MGHSDRSSAAILRLIVLAIPALVFVGCTSTSREVAPDFDPKPFETFSGSAVLCFDVQADDGQAKAGLLLRVAQDSPAGRREIVLPFRTRAVTTNRNLLLASGSYDRFTLLSFSFGTPSLGTSAVAFVPDVKAIAVNTPQIEGLEPGVYFQENGLERWFVYVDGTPEVVTTIQRDFPTSKVDSIDGIAIAIPEQAEGRDVKKGSSVDPKPAIRVGNVMLFGAPIDNDSRRVALRYAIQPTAAQTAAANNGLKFILIIIIPIFTLVFLNPEEIQRPRLRRAAIAIGVVLQTILALVVVWISLRVRPSAEAWTDFLLAGLGVVGEVVIILVKAKHKAGPAPGSGKGVQQPG